MLPPLPLPLQLEVDKATTNVENTSIPGFTNLHRHLTTHVLDDDGSTRSRNRDYEASGIVERLHGRHVRHVRRWILIRCLLEICLLDPPSEAAGVGDDDGSEGMRGEMKMKKKKRRVEGLPIQLRGLCYIVASYLALRPQQLRTRVNARGRDDGHDEHDDDNGNEADRERSEQEELISDDLDAFHQHTTEITSCLNRHLIDLEDTVTELLGPVSKSIESSPLQDDNGHHGSEAESPTNRIPYRTTRPLSQRTHDNHPTSSSSLNTNTESRTRTRSRSSATHTTLQTSHLHTTCTTTIPTLLHSILHTYSRLKTLQTTHLTHLIRHAELYTHGTRSRHALSHASFLSAVATGLDLKTRVAVLERELDLYAGLAGREGGKGKELKVLVERLEEEDRELDREVGEREGWVEEYLNATGGSGSGGGSGSRGGRREREGGGMEVWGKLGREYADIHTELKEVRDDVLKLEGEVERSGAGGGRGGGLSSRRDGSERGGRRKR